MAKTFHCARERAFIQFAIHTIVYIHMYVYADTYTYVWEQLLLLRNPTCLIALDRHFEYFDK